MNEELKAVSEIASDIGVSRQAVYQKLKAPTLADAVKPFTVKQHNLTLYTLQGQALIRQSFDEVVNAVNVDSKRQSTNGKLIDTLQATIETLTKQLEVKDNQIASMQKQIDKLTETVGQMASTANTGAIVHAGTTQALLNEQNQQAPKPEPAQTSEPRPAAASATSRTVSAPRPRSERAPQPSPSFLDFIKNKFQRKQK